MKIFKDINEVKLIRNAVVTTGSFDGVHIGHKAIIDRINKLAKEINGESVLITFYPHPRKVLYPDDEGKSLKLICSQAEKIELLEKTNLDNLIIINFTVEFSKTSSFDFVKNIMINKIGAKIIVVGFNHYFGYNREGNYDFLYKMKETFGFSVEEIPKMEIQNETVSSTKIRKAITEGNIQKANAYLDHYYTIRATIFNSILNNVNFNFCNCIVDDYEKLLPPQGIYAISIYQNNCRIKGLLCIINSEYFLCNESIKELFKNFADNKNDRLLFLFLDKEYRLTENVYHKIMLHKKMGDLKSHGDISGFLQIISEFFDSINDLIF